MKKTLVLVLVLILVFSVTVFAARVYDLGSKEMYDLGVASEVNTLIDGVLASDIDYADLMLSDNDSGDIFYNLADYNTSYRENVRSILTSGGINVADRELLRNYVIMNSAKFQAAQEGSKKSIDMSEIVNVAPDVDVATPNAVSISVIAENYYGDSVTVTSLGIQHNGSEDILTVAPSSGVYTFSGIPYGDYHLIVNGTIVEAFLVSGGTGYPSDVTAYSSDGDTSVVSWYAPGLAPASYVVFLGEESKNVSGGVTSVTFDSPLNSRTPKVRATFSSGMSLETTGISDGSSIDADISVENDNVVIVSTDVRDDGGNQILPQEVKLIRVDTDSFKQEDIRIGYEYTFRDVPAGEYIVEVDGVAFDPVAVTGLTGEPRNVLVAEKPDGAEVTWSPSLLAGETSYKVSIDSVTLPAGTDMLAVKFGALLGEGVLLFEVSFDGLIVEFTPTPDILTDQSYEEIIVDAGENTATVLVDVRDFYGNIVGGHTVYLEHDESGQRVNPSSSSNSSFAFNNLPALSYTVYVNGEEVEVIEPTGYTGEITSVYFEDLSDDDEALEADYAEVTWSADYFTGIASVRIIAGGQNKSWMYGPSKLVTFNTPFNLEPMDPEAEPLEYEFEVDPVFEVTYTNGLVIKYTPEYTYIPFEAPEEPVV